MFERSVTLDGIRVLSPRTFVLSYRCPEMAAAALPGQFVMIAAGGGIDPLLRRPMAVYGVSTRDGRADGLSLLVERRGRGTQLMAGFRPGAVTRVLGPLGTPFRPPADGADREHLLVMGGVGAAPFPLLAAELRRRGQRARAFVGGRTAADLLCLDDFARLGVPVTVTTDDGSAGCRGLVTEALRAYLAEAAGPFAVYSCGPTAMMRAVDDLARGAALPHQVSLEAPMACGIGVCLSCVVRVGEPRAWAYRRVCREGPVFDAATIVWS